MLYYIIIINIIIIIDIVFIYSHIFLFVFLFYFCGERFVIFVVHILQVAFGLLLTRKIILFTDAIGFQEVLDHFYI